VPFRAAVRAGAALVMLSSAVYPALSSRPAVLSPRVVQRELRAGLHFDGVTVSDDLEAPAFDDGPTAAGLQATRAGVDLLLYARTYAAADRAADALADAVRAGTVDRTTLEASRRRIEALRASLAG
jgi:beta-N-acetylhexosaminidase